MVVLTGPEVEYLDQVDVLSGKAGEQASRKQVKISKMRCNIFNYSPEVGSLIYVDVDDQKVFDYRMVFILKSWIVKL